MIRHIDSLTEMGLLEALEDEGRDPAGTDWQIACGGFQAEAVAMRILGSQKGVVRDKRLAHFEWRIVPVEEMV